MIPIGDSPKSKTTPWVNYAFIAINIAVFLYTLSLSTEVPPNRVVAAQQFQEQQAGICYGFPAAPTEIDRFYCRWSFQPAEWFDTARGESETPGQDRVEVLSTILTSIFLHGGWLHIIGNMLFLWVFGDNVEDRLGHLGYAAFFLLAGLAAALTQGFIDMGTAIPNVGASGAVAGILGAYLVYYPKARVTTLIPIAVVLVPIPVPAVLMIGFWFVQNLFSGFATLSPDVGTPDSGVAFFAHIGGFVFGALAVLLFLRGAGERRRAR